MYARDPGPHDYLSNRDIKQWGWTDGDGTSESICLCAVRRDSRTVKWLQPVITHRRHSADHRSSTNISKADIQC